MNPTVLLADDDPAVLTVLDRAFQKRGFKTRCARDGDEMLALVKNGAGDALVLDVMMPYGGKSGSSFDWMEEITRVRPHLPVVVISALAALPTAVKATRLGAYECIPKPFDLTRVVGAVELALKRAEQGEVSLVPSPSQPVFMQMMGRSEAMNQVYKIIARLVDNDLTVMITGESGTGKELVARAIHELGVRATKPFMAINMAAIPRELVESELFGHEKGAFTGAVARKSGLFEQAKGGTLFLDEIGDMPVEAQSKLLRVLQQGEFIAVGGTRVQKTDVRIICATHRDLLEKVALGAFREDLYYRLNVVPIRVPSLRERKEDIPEIAGHLMARAVSRGLPERRLGEDAMQALMAYAWPGNVRELENTLYRLMALAPSREIDAASVRHELPVIAPASSTTLEDAVEAHLKAYFAAHNGDLPPDGLMDRILPFFERPLITQALAATGGNQIRAAKLLGVNRNTLRKRMKELGVTV
jgi:two-component system, NtrC family, nitrogen regulation response regulator GlnG